MAMCPLLREECRGEKCAWWYEAEDEAYSQCSVSQLPDLLNGIVDELEDVKTDVSDVYDKVADVYDRLGSGITTYEG